jgi:hypothetical protein
MDKTKRHAKKPRLRDKKTRQTLDGTTMRVTPFYENSPVLFDFSFHCRAHFGRNSRHGQQEFTQSGKFECDTA